MSLLERFNRRDSRIQDQLERASTSTVMELIKQSSESAGGPFPVPAGKVPAGIEFEDYMKRLQAETTKRLGATTLADSIIFNPEASLVASTRRIEVEPGHAEIMPKRSGITLVFERPVMLR